GGGAEHLRGLRARPGRAHRTRGARPATGDGGRADGRTGSAAPVAAVVLPVAGAVAAGVAVAVLVGLVGLIRLVGFVAVVGAPDGDAVPGAVRGQLVRAADRVGGPCVAVGCGRLDQVVRTGRQAVEGAGAGRAGGAAPARHRVGIGARRLESGRAVALPPEGEDRAREGAAVLGVGLLHREGTVRVGLPGPGVLRGGADPLGG